jgi:hypothetical protein
VSGIDIAGEIVEFVMANARMKDNA